MQILHRDEDALLLVLPSDHYVRNEPVLAASVQEAMAYVDRRRDRIVLLGLVADEPDSELGYIVPNDDGGTSGWDVSQFIEKPSVAIARQLMERGGLWNSFIFAAHGQTLLRAFEARCPQIVRDMRAIVARDSTMSRLELAQLYERLPSLDFSRDIIEASPSMLRARASAVAHLQGFIDLAARQLQAQAS